MFYILNSITMAEENKGEDVNLNSNGQGDWTWTEGTQGDGSQKTTFTLEEVEAMKAKMQSDSMKWVQKLLDQQKAYEAVIDGVAKISDDPKHLIILSETKPEVAKMILDKYYNGQKLEEYAKDMWIEIDLNDPEIVKKRIASEAERIADEREISKEKESFIKEFEMTDEEKEQFEAAFSERMQLKSFSTKDLRKHLEKAYREIDSDSEGRKKLEQQATIGRAMSTGAWKDTGTQTDPTKKNREEAKGFLAKHKIL